MAEGEGDGDRGRAIPAFLTGTEQIQSGMAVQTCGDPHLNLPPRSRGKR